MLTAIVWDANAPRSLALTLATLVPAAIDGALREVAVADVEARAEARFVADHAGCRLLGNETPAEVARSCKGRWLLVVRSGDRLPAGWLDAVMRWDGENTNTARLSVDPSDPPVWRSWFGPRRSALLISRDALMRSEQANWTSLVRSTGGRRLRARGETRV